MKRSAAQRWALLLAAVTLLAGCGRVEKVLAFGATAEGVDKSVVLDPPKRAVKRPCEGLLVNDDRLAAPAPLPAPEDTAWLLGRGVEGADVHLGWVLGTASRVPDLMRLFEREGRGRGYDVTVTRDGLVMQVTYRGRADVDITVQPYCREHLAIRYVARSLDPSPPLLLAAGTAAALPCPAVEPESAPQSYEQSLLPFPADASPLRVGGAAQATVYTALVPGAPAGAGALREELVAELVKQGYVAAGFPLEESRAVAALVGRRTGLLTVQPWCRGKLAIRYSLLPYVEVEQVAAVGRRPCTGREDTEPLRQPFPSWLQRGGPPPLFDRAGGDFHLWTVLVGDDGKGSKTAQAADTVLVSLDRTGVKGRAAGELPGLSGRVLRSPAGDMALLAVRPWCLIKQAEVYVVPS